MANGRLWRRASQSKMRHIFWNDADSRQVDALVLAELVKDKLPEIHKHFEKVHMSLLLLVTKWFMCIFVGNLPTEVGGFFLQS